jgi:hypothetical protein
LGRLTVAGRRAATSGWLTRAPFLNALDRFCGKEEGETNHAERWFGTLCSRISRLVCRTYSFSKNIERDLDAIHLFVTTHNLRIQQQSTVS